MDSSQIIDELGGPTVVARLLHIQGPGAVQRVHNWRRRGIPARVILDHPEVFGALAARQPSPIQPEPLTAGGEHV